MSIDDEWKTYLKKIANEESGIMLTESFDTPSKLEKFEDNFKTGERPVCDPLYISTQTKVLFLNQSIDTNDIFWKIPVTEYWKPEECVIKKQMKIVSKSKEEFEQYQQKLIGVPYYIENVINQIDNPTAIRIKFKDERKITIGVSKKDIMNCRGKVKHAFYNCFAVIFRFKETDDNYEMTGNFREIHVKIFNTGKLEIPGILNKRILTKVKQMILEYIGAYTKEPLNFKEENARNHNVLINSNFNCGYFINREKLYAILRSNTYAIETAFDPCSYPGVKCKFYFNHDYGFDTELQRGQIQTSDKGMKMSEIVINQKYTEISFMIFRTGSCLIVGNCDEDVLVFVYDFIKKMLYDQYENICVLNEVGNEKIKKTKIRKRTIYLTQN
uniref:Uncharacterized protein n=1 Tax=viral metagenome TaxID=1070528 RepID=A0A6C0I009_9ZZZZ